MRRFSLNQAGDTIIEVMVAVAILALVLTVAYQSTSRSLQSGVDSSNRQQAIALASQQIEIIKNAETSPQGEPALNAYHAAGAFCIDGTKLDNSNYGRSQNISACHSVNNSVFSLTDTYKADAVGAGGVFTVVATWPSTVSGGSGQSQITLYYR